MIDLFLSLVISSLVGSVMWLVQNSIRPITHKLFSQTWHYYTGLIPVFFLLGGSVIINRLIQLIRSLPPSTVSPILGPTLGEFVHILPVEQTASSISFINQLLNNLLHLNNINEIVLFVLLIWAVGTFAFIALNILNLWLFKRSILQESRVSKTVQCPVKVIISAKATTPMLIGLWKPIVILPDTQLGERELALILSHELVHLQRGDLFVKLLVLVANAIHWFNPAAYSLNKQINFLCELSCDEKVVQKMDRESRRFYGETLLAMLEYGVMGRNIVCTSSFCHSKKYMQRRLSNLMKVKKTNRSIIMLSLVVTMAMFGIGGLAAYAAGSAVPFDYLSGNLKPEEPKGSHTPRELSIEEILERIRLHEEKGLQVPEGYLHAIKLHEEKGLPLPKANHNTSKLAESLEPIDFSADGGRNIFIQHPDGTVEYYDQEGNRTLVPHMRRNIYPPVDEDTQKRINELNEKIDSYIQKGLPAPQEYLDKINELYGIKPFGDK